MPQTEKHFLRIEALGAITDVEVSALAFIEIAPTASFGRTSMTLARTFYAFDVWLPGSDMTLRKLLEFGGIIRKITIRKERDFGRSKHSRIVATAVGAFIDSYKKGAFYNGKNLDEVRFRCKQGTRT